jgi:hypothetical protein
MASTREQATQLSGIERILLLVPTAGGLVFGLATLVAPVQFAQTAGATGHDPYIYQLAGAATLGYGAALLWALLGTSYARVRLLLTAVLGFNLGSLYACGVEIAGGHAQSVVYLILVASLIFVAITGTLLYTHHSAPRPPADVASWLVWFLVAATVLSIPFALLPLFFPVQFGQHFGFQATDVFTYRLGGAALLGYAFLGIFEIRSRSWAEIRSAAVMVVAFNALAAIVSIGVLITAPGAGKTLAPLVAGAAGVVAVATFVELLRGGK